MDTSDIMRFVSWHSTLADANPVAIAESRKGTESFADHITYVTCDSVAFLEAFGEPIDLLYLASMDCPREGDASAAQAHTLRELQAGLPKLTRQAVVLIDDNGYRNGGKALESKRYLAGRGWVSPYDARQTVRVRGNGMAA